VLPALGAWCDQFLVDEAMQYQGRSVLPVFAGYVEYVSRNYDR
jgi:hypothetical protein